jgi:protein tyrosine/serine phosphatase
MLRCDFFEENSFLENTSLCVNIDLVVINTQANDKELLFMVHDGVELVTGVSPVQVNSSLVQVWQDHYLVCLKIIVVFDDVG